MIHSAAQPRAKRTPSAASGLCTQLPRQHPLLVVLFTPSKQRQQDFTTLGSIYETLGTKHLISFSLILSSTDCSSLSCPLTTDFSHYGVLGPIDSTNTSRAWRMSQVMPQSLTPPF